MTAAAGMGMGMGSDSALFGSRVLTAPTLTLQITSGDVTLLNRGMTAVTVTDGTNPVTGCTLHVADTSKCTASGQVLTGAANAGSTTVYASKAGYTDSATITITCSALNFILDPALGTNTTTNGQPVTSWTDQGSAAAAFTEATNPPTYNTNSQNGLPGITFTSASSNKLQTAAGVATLNAAPLSLFIICKPTAAGDGSATSRTVFSNAVSTAGGCIIRFISTNKLEVLVEGGAQSSIQTTSTYTGGAARYITLLLANGAQTLRVGGVTEATPANAYAASAAISALADSIGGSSYFPGDMLLVLASTRTWSATEYGQLELMARTRYAL